MKEKQSTRKVYRLKDLPRWIVNAIKTSKMNSKHDHLNKLLDEKT